MGGASRSQKTGLEVSSPCVSPGAHRPPLGPLQDLVASFLWSKWSENLIGRHLSCSPERLQLEGEFVYLHFCMFWYSTHLLWTKLYCGENKGKMRCTDHLRKVTLNLGKRAADWVLQCGCTWGTFSQWHLFKKAMSGAVGLLLLEVFSLWLGCHRTMVLLNIEQLGKRCLRPNPHLICGHLKRIKHADNQTGSSHLHIPLFQFQSLGRIMWQFFKIPFQDIVLLIMYSEISSHREHPYTVAHKWLPPPLSSGVRCFIMTGTRIVTAHIFTLSVLLCTFPHLITTLQKIIFFIIDSD